MSRRVATEVLEQMVDSHGLEAVLEALAEVCELKAEHVESNWQDRALAKLWHHAGTRIGATAASSPVRGLR